MLRLAAMLAVIVFMVRGIYAFLPDRIAYSEDGGVTTLGMMITVVIMGLIIPPFVEDFTRASGKSPDA